MKSLYYLDLLFLIAASIAITYGIYIKFFTLFLGCLVIGMVLLNSYYSIILYKIQKKITDYVNKYLEHMQSRK